VLFTFRSPAGYPTSARRAIGRRPPERQRDWQIQQWQTWRKASVCRNRNVAMTRRVMEFTMTDGNGSAAAWDQSSDERKIDLNIRPASCPYV